MDRNLVSDLASLEIPRLAPNCFFCFAPKQGHEHGTHNQGWDNNPGPYLVGPVNEYFNCLHGAKLLGPYDI